MIKKMNVSICIPTYNRPDLLKETLDSCLTQSVLPYEIVIGDDSKNNETEEFIKNFSNSTGVLINYYHHKPSLKQAENTNFIFKHAKGDKIVLLHDDDLLVSDAIETLLNVFKNDSSIQIAYGKCYIMSDGGTINESESKLANDYFYKKKEYEGSILSPLEAGIIQQFPNNGYMIDSKIAKEVKWRTETEYANLGAGCEFDFGIRLGQQGFKMYFINKYLVKYRITAISSSTSSTDSAYKSYLILENIEVKAEYQKMKNIALQRKAPKAIMEAIKHNQPYDARRIYLSKNHLLHSNLLGLLKRTLFLTKYLILRN
ncbi:glycosyltransferase [Kriegella sp. EG-1]|nr:glycosyltransferase [Flavobacteriaceae bacterium EG-1]